MVLRLVCFLQLSLTSHSFSGAPLMSHRAGSRLLGSRVHPYLLAGFTFLFGEPRTVGGRSLEGGHCIWGADADL